MSNSFSGIAATPFVDQNSKYLIPIFGGSAIKGV